jgi:hypothetical protein
MMKLLLAVTVVVLVAGPAWASEVLLVVMKGTVRARLSKRAGLDEGAALLQRRPRRLSRVGDPDRRPSRGFRGFVASENVT